VAKAIFTIILIPILVALNGCFVAVEMAFARTRRARIDQLAAQGNRAALLAQRSLESPDKFISASQLGITLATLALGGVAEHDFGQSLASALWHTGLSATPAVVSSAAKAACYVVAFSCTALLQIVFGELLPKMLTYQRAERVLLFFIAPMEYWQVVTTPILSLLNALTRSVINVLHIEEPPQRDLVNSEEELKLLVSASHEQGVLDESEKNMLHSVFDFSDAEVHEIMTPRTDIVGLPADSTTRQFIEMAINHGRTRIPVYDGSIDNITGFVHIKDALRAVHQNNPNTPVRELARRVLVVPENKNLATLLKEFNKSKTHMAIVLDEYGATCGLVTIQDLLEELVGDIADEHEIEGEEEFFRHVDGSYTIDGKLSLDSIRERTQLNISDPEFNTLAGHVFGLLGRHPQVGDEVMDSDNNKFRIEAIDGQRITRVLCRKMP
jgi:CBS domain containing-hemolysin-like protein